MVHLACENSAGATTGWWERCPIWHPVSDQTVGNILRRHGIAPVPERSQTTTWRDFIRRHMDVLAGTDFFTVDVLTWRGLVTYYVLFCPIFHSPGQPEGLHCWNHRSSGGVLDASGSLQRDI